jgi:tetratricopeptide (TPR) repeat protein
MPAHPLFAEAQSALQQQRPDVAESALRRYLQIRPDDADALRLLAVAIHQQGRHAESMALLQQIVERLPGFALAHMNMGSVLRALGKAEKAIEAFRTASVIEPRRAAIWFNLAKALKHQGRIAEATVAIATAVQLEPKHSGALIVQGDLAKANGDVSLARQAFRAAITERPAAGAGWWGLANLKTVRLTESDVAAMQQALQALPDRPIEDRVQIEFALARALEHRGEYETAMQALHRANRLQRRRIAWDRTAFSSHADHVMAAFAHTEAQSTLGSECIFVVSPPRSGSTLVEQILAAHAHVSGASELPDFPRLMDEASRARHTSFPSWVQDSTPDDWHAIGLDYLDCTRRWRTESPISTDKLPDNFLYIGAILRALPRARVVFCDRDPRDVMLSCYQQFFAKGHAFSYDLNDIRSYLLDYRRLTTHWLTTFPEQCLRMHYESLVEAPEPEIRRLLAHCRLPFDPACLQPQLAQRSVRTASAAQVREPIDQRGIGRWQPYAAWLPPLD